VRFDAIALQAGSVTTVDEFKQWTRAVVRPAFPHEMLVSGFGRLHAGGVSLDYAVGIDFPTSYLEGLRNRTGGVDTPILRSYLATLEPQLFEAERPWPIVPPRWFECFRSHNMRNVAAHGVYDIERCVATYHSFYRIPGRLGPDHAEALKQLVPILHESLCRAVEPLLDSSGPRIALASLTSREKEIAQWVGLGKSNGVIAKISGLSENTVKHHLTNIFSKLAVESRAELIHRLAEDDVRRGQASGLKIL
jgi:DNA-binding CsgD family transcriptional regulator